MEKTVDDYNILQDNSQVVMAYKGEEPQSHRWYVKVKFLGAINVIPADLNGLFVPHFFFFKFYKVFNFFSA